MSKKSNLIYAYTRALSLSKKGSYATRQARLKIMRSIVEDLCLLRCVPYKWQELTMEQIRKIVDYWKSNKLKQEAIANKISVLRKTCLLIDKTCSFPSNKGLQIQMRSSKQIASPYSDEILLKIENSIIRTIIELEIYFGLTKSEAIKLPGHSIADNRVIIYRDIAYNHRDHIIPITMHEQYNTLAQRAHVIKKYSAQDSLLDIATFGKLAGLYRCELAILNIQGHSHFRQIYAKRRYTDLTKATNSSNAIEVLQKELGLSSNRLLKVWVK